MKTILSALIALITFSSCGNKFTLQKRKYTGGFYFAGIHPKKKTAVNNYVEIEAKPGNSKPETVYLPAAKAVSADQNSANSHTFDAQSKTQSTGKYSNKINLPVLNEKHDKDESSAPLSLLMKNPEARHDLKFGKAEKRGNILVDGLVGYFVISMVLMFIVLIYLIVSGGIVWSAIVWPRFFAYLAFIVLCILIGRSVRK